MVSMKVMFFSYFVALVFIISIVSFESGYSQNNSKEITSTTSENISHVNQTRIDLIMNPNFIFFNETTGLPSNWDDPRNSCKAAFSCTIKFTDGWNDYVSFGISTTNNLNNTWASIYGKQMDVKPGEQVQLVSHMKLNQWVTQSHVVLEGFNETSKQWYRIAHCPSGVNGPMEWQEFSCTITIPKNTTEIRPILNAGWSSQPNREATTWFDAINLLTNMPLSKGILK